MEENDESSAELPNFHGTQEIFQGAQEAQADRRFPIPQGVVQLPRGSKGARSLYLQRQGNNFGFTLRHFIVYPPDSIAEDDGRHAKSGCLYQPMDTIFVKEVYSPSARLAGLRKGDRIVAVNSCHTANLTYAEVVQRITNSPDYLHLLVVSKEEDVIQRLFPDSHNPYSNQTPLQPEQQQSRSIPQQDRARQILTRHITQQQQQQQIKADPAAWHYLQLAHHYPPNRHLLQSVQRYRGVPGNDLGRQGQQRSAESILDSRGQTNQQELYAEILRPNEVQYRQRSRAAPQVPLFRKMGRRASEGSNVLSNTEYSGATSLTYSDEDSGHYVETMKAIYKPSYLSSSGENMGLPDQGYRMQSDVNRRESISSMADSSKDSITSCDSNSTLTGKEIDDSVRISRVRQSVRQKEEFLRTPVLRAFHGRPKKLEKTMWPPNDYPVQAPGRNINKPIHHNVNRIRNDLDSEREMISSGYNGDHSGGVPSVATPTVDAHSPKGRNEYDSSLREAETAPNFETETEAVKKENAVAEARRSVINYILAYLFPMMNPPNLYNVQKKAKEFENYPEASRTNIPFSELARLSKKVLQPNVTERAHEYEVKNAVPEAPRKDPSTTSTASAASLSAPKRIQRDSRSLDSSDIPSSNETRQFRARSNSAESWATALGDKDSITATPPPTTPSTLPPQSPLIPEPVIQLQVTPSVSVTPAPPTRPTSLDLEGPQRPARHKTSNADRFSSELDSNLHDIAINVKRRNKNTNLGDDRAKRPDSYLKATKGEQASFGSDLSDFEDLAPQALRNRYRKWQPSPFWGDIDQLVKLFEDSSTSKGGSGSANSSSSVSLERDNKASASASPVPYKKEAQQPTSVVREGPVHCKILEIEGKRAADRSWKQANMVLKGSKLFLYKVGHHQSPLGTSDVSLDQSLAAGVDIRSSTVRVAGEYTKRKNVIGLTTLKPCKSQLLIQAERTKDFEEWMSTLKEHAINSETDLDANIGRQQAVPQQMPASTTIQVPASHLSPQPINKNGKSTSSGRNRSPTGQSPVSKTRKPSSQHTDAAGSTSPKNKTWKGRVVKQLKKFNQGTNSPSSPTTAEGSTFGIPIKDCLPSHNNNYVPRFIEICTDIIDDKGLQTIGIYRVPGNNASITALTEEINRNTEDIQLEDPRWKDLHVVSSLLKSYLRKMPDSLITSALYPHFIKADKIEDPKKRMEELKKLVRCLPKHNYHTLKHVILHLKRVADNWQYNKMESKNLAIVFGPTIVRPEGETMESMVTNMNNQCKIVESLIANADWFFPENENENAAPVVPLALPDHCEEFESNSQALLDNISKYEALKDQKEKNGALFTSLISAAHRKVMRKPSRTHTHESNREEPTTPTSPRSFGQFSLSVETKENSERTIDNSKPNTIPTTVMDLEKKDRSKPPSEKSLWFNYQTDSESLHKRIENFKQETEANLRPRKREVPAASIDPKSCQLSSSVSNVNTGRLSSKPQDFALTKTHSATNVFTRPSPPANRNSLNSMDTKKYSVQYSSNSLGNDVSRYSYSASSRSSSDKCSPSSSALYSESIDTKLERYPMRRGSSAENVNCSTLNLNSNGGQKKVKYENENDSQRRGSLDSLNKIQGEEESLLSSFTKLMDQKFKEEKKSSESNLFQGADLPFVDESPEKQPSNNLYKYTEKENISRQNDLYKNPSLHKIQYSATKQFKSTTKVTEPVLKECKNEKEKEEDTRASEDVPDNERHISVTVIANKINSSSKLKRSESLNKTEKNVSTGLNKVKRSESLNKSGDKLKRSDSLTKTEKTESNINKRRELLASGRRLKESTKNKRKNGMPDRSIKRRHTVGGTKDPDKVTYVDNKNQDENNPHAENNKEKGIRTSSPDLSSTRRERLLFEINLIGPENMVVALRQHLIGSRPQSFPEPIILKRPLESHV
ncbi:rho GTPase activating protein at 19D isoform X8 [Rhynchophorus ferrugineus]|uniref:rho GTPase activating protein at 19D isoform X8 n=1 Tax=Rhynchophorus ferrugineus TaxID=354439 RepID=UPI003FCEA666